VLALRNATVSHLRQARDTFGNTQITSLLSPLMEALVDIDLVLHLSVINAASLAYAPFVLGTLGMLLKVYLTESHDREGGSSPNSNTSGESLASTSRRDKDICYIS